MESSKHGLSVSKQIKSRERVSAYVGINKHEGENVGGFDTVLKNDEYKNLFVNEDL